MEANAKKQSSLEMIGMDNNYKNEIKLNELYRNFYLEQKCEGYQKWQLQIDDWINRTVYDEKKKKLENRPLVIQGPYGIGKRTLINRWVTYNQEINKLNRHNDIILFQYGSSILENDENKALYDICIEIRRQLNIHQKVDLVKEKIKKYFYYWLELASKQIDKNCIEGQKLVIVIEGINNFGDNGLTSILQFWLPQNYPKNVRMVLLMDNDDLQERQILNLNYLQKIGCDFLTLKRFIDDDEPLFPCQIIYENYIQDIEELESKDTERVQKVKEIFQNLHLNLKSNGQIIEHFLSTFLPRSTQNNFKFLQNKLTYENILKILKDFYYDELLEIDCQTDYFREILEFCKRHMMGGDQMFEQILHVLIFSQKGMSYQDLEKLFPKILRQEIELIVFFMNGMIIFQQDVLLIKDTFSKQLLLSLYPCPNNQQQQVHLKIANMLETKPISIHNLQEECYNLFMSKNYFRLKEKVSVIENFLLFYNINNKNQLCYYWQKLEEQNFDPVIEYNKAIEQFQMNFKPNSEDLFSIVFQLSRFLKEFSDFESIFTPKFRHPPIFGGKELEQIGLLQELKMMSLHFQFKINMKPKMLNDVESINIDIEGNKKIFRNYYIQQVKEILEMEKQYGNNNAFYQFNDNEKGNSNSDKMQEMVEQQQILMKLVNKNSVYEENIQASQMDSTNEILHNNNNSYKRSQRTGSHHDMIKKFSGLQVEQDLKGTVYTNENYVNEHNNNNENMQMDLTAEQNNNSMILNNSNIHNQNHKKYQSQRDFNFQRLPNMYERNLYYDQKPQYYYYKRWLWVIFPWACLSENEQRCNYSQQIKKSNENRYEYMTIQQEETLNRRALMIALDAKIQKKLVFQDSNTVENRIQKLKNFKNNMSRNMSTGGQSSKQKMKRQNSSILTTNNVYHLNRTNNQNVSISNDEMLFLTNDISAINKVDQKENIQINQNTMKENILDEYQSLLQKHNKAQFQNLKINNKINANRREMSIQAFPILREDIKNINQNQLDKVNEQNRSIIKQYDTMVYSNRIQQKLFSRISVQNENLQNNKRHDRLQELYNRVAELEQLIQQQQEKFDKSRIVVERVRMILFIQKSNKNCIEDFTRQLDFLLKNFIKSIEDEKKNIKKNKSSIVEIYNLISNSCQESQDNLRCKQKLVNDFMIYLNKSKDLNQKITFIQEDQQQTSYECQQSQYQQQNSNHQSQYSKVFSGKSSMKKFNQNENEIQQFDEHENLQKLVKKIEQVSKLLSIEEVDSFEDINSNQNFRQYLSNQQNLRKRNQYILEQKNKIHDLKMQLENLKTKNQQNEIMNEENNNINISSVQAKMEYQEDLKKQTQFGTKHELQKAIQKENSNNQILMAQFKKNQTKQINITQIIEKLQQIFNIKGEHKDIEKIDFSSFLNMIENKMEVIQKGLSEDDYKQFQDGVIGSIQIKKKYK